MPAPTITLTLLPSGTLALDRGPDLRPIPLSSDPAIAQNFLYQTLLARQDNPKPAFATPALPSHFWALAFQGQPTSGFTRRIPPGIKHEPAQPKPKILSTPKTLKQLGL